MAKRNCTPYSAAFPSQKTLFNPWPTDQLEPYGNPAYEGVGYPAAGYGQSRRKVVPLALPRVAAPQLSNKGWEGKVPQGTIVTVGTLNPKSDSFTRAQVASLAGLGCNCSKTDQRMRANLQGLGAAQMGVVQSLANSIANNVVPLETVNNIANKILADERANAEAYRLIKVLEKLQPNNAMLPKLRADQQKAWGQTNTAKFYAFLIPVMRERLVGKVTVPDYAYVKQNSDGGVFTSVAKVVQDSMVGDAARQLMQQRLLKDSSIGLAGLGAVPFAAVGIVAAGLIAAGLVAYMASTLSETVKSITRAQAIAACKNGTLSDAACLAAIEGAKAPEPTNFNDIAKYGAYALGAVVLLQVIGSVRSAFPAGAR